MLARYCVNPRTSPLLGNTDSRLSSGGHDVYGVQERWPRRMELQLRRPYLYLPSAFSPYSLCTGKAGLNFIVPHRIGH